MTESLVEILLRPLADAFMQVGVLVALLVAPFGWARLRWGHRLDDALVRHRQLGPLVAALLTVPPGCGGAIIVMAVYARGAVSYGAAIAALVATMGDASWVLLAADPVLTLQLKVLLIVVGALSGYVVDALGIAPRRRVDLLPAAGRSPAPSPPVRVAAMRLPAPARLHDLGVLPALLWLSLGTGATISVPVTFQLLRPDTLYLALGVAGTAVAAVAFIRGGCQLADDDDETAHPTSMTQVLRHGGREIAFVTVWVAAAYVAWSLITHLTGFDGSQMPLFGVVGVVVGALVGLIPGCAVQIVFVGLFLAGGMPLPTLVANMVSQDGDALLPLLALEHRSALLATVLTTVPALLVGSAMLILT
ncbi:putative manganese transporter [Nocardioides sp. cx-169]|uniref:putative manganese transporter n=1 Tax=Nocardioides sp. cx-169 TaxID=2899080 RepID=UPI001E4D2845|nr:putative manganese transporter [Nocardioides sp. cx-169]MCD4535525.1 putative manganese transporter [Nocardioides sp. cx-169]